MNERDHIDRLVLKWGKERPDYDLAPVQITGRIGRIFEYVDRALEAKFAEFDISRASFDVLASGSILGMFDFSANPGTGQGKGNGNGNIPELILDPTYGTVVSNK